jgi:broad specificity phosphatase PhoE
MWFVGKEVSRPTSEVPDHVKARALTYWESRLAEAIKSDHPNAYRQELGVISQWCFHGQVDEAWLCEQLILMLRAGFAPSDAYSVVEWLGEVAQRHVDRAAEVLALLLRHPDVDQWAYMTHRDPIRIVLLEGLTKGADELSDECRIRSATSRRSAKQATSISCHPHRPPSDRAPARGPLCLKVAQS